LFALVFLFLAQPTAAGGGYTCSTAGICANNGTCSSFGTNPSNVLCNCLPGYSGAQCQFRVINDCNGNPAPDVWVGDNVCNNGNIKYGSNWISFNCPAFDSDGGDCGTPMTVNNHGACTPNPCGTGKCFGSDSKYWCSCPRNAAGANCQAVVDGCSSSPCANGGRCISDITKLDNFKCVCKGYYLDSTCTTPFPSGGVVSPTCTQSCTNGYCSSTNHCTCNSGYYGTGDNCTANTGCSSSPCANGGLCLPSTTHNTYNCFCASGYGGSTCTNTIAACFPNPCHSGYCSSASGNLPYSCLCDQNHNGLNCSFPINQYDCEAHGFPPVFVGDGTCEHQWTYLDSSSFSVSRYDMVDCSPRGDADCPSEESAGSRVVLSVLAFMMTVLAVFIL